MLAADSQAVYANRELGQQQASSKSRSMLDVILVTMHSTQMIHDCTSVVPEQQPGVLLASWTQFGRK